MHNFSSVDCGPLSDPANGTVELTDTLVGSRATYNCNSGYSIVGEATVTCQSNGNWSGSATCLGIINVVQMK